MECHICEHPDHDSSCQYPRAPMNANFHVEGQEVGRCHCNKRSLWKAFMRPTRREAEDLADHLTNEKFTVYQFYDGQLVVRPINAWNEHLDHWMVVIFTTDPEVLASHEAVAEWKKQAQKYDAEVARV